MFHFYIYEFAYLLLCLFGFPCKQFCVIICFIRVFNTKSIELCQLPGCSEDNSIWFMSNFKTFFTSQKASEHSYCHIGMWSQQYKIYGNIGFHKVQNLKTLPNHDIVAVVWYTNTKKIKNYSTFKYPQITRAFYNMDNDM